jgi:hypothetical protein
MTLAGTVVLMAGLLLLIGPGAAFAQSAAEEQYSSAPAPASAPASASPTASANASPDYVGGPSYAQAQVGFLQGVLQAITPATTIVGGNPYQPPASSTPATTIVGGNPYQPPASSTPVTAIQGLVQSLLNQPSGTTWLSGPGNWIWMGCDDPNDVRTDKDGRACTDTNPNNPNE